MYRVCVGLYKTMHKECGHDLDTGVDTIIRELL